MFDVIERLKADWTDKYVVIDSPAPELARFARATGQVKTVNMNGRCLVEFDQFNNIGWYDVDPSCLKIVPKPLPKPAETKEKAPKAAAKPAAAKAPAAPAAGGAKKPSTAEILAAARAKAGSSAGKPAGGEKPPSGEKLSTAEILARARGAKAGGATPAEPPAAETAPEAEAAAVAPPANAAKKASGKQPTTTADKIAWCREHDAKG
jgi:hypothetical protein